jgi:hypothetical protein
MRRPLSPLTALAPAQVWSRSYVQGSGALTTRAPSWSGDGVATAACDEPATSSVERRCRSAARRGRCATRRCRSAGRGRSAGRQL